MIIDYAYLLYINHRVIVNSHYRFGKDPFPLVLLAQNCSASYLTIGQCLQVLNSSNCVKGVDDVSVVCSELKCLIFIIMHIMVQLVYVNRIN